MRAKYGKEKRRMTLMWNRSVKRLTCWRERGREREKERVGEREEKEEEDGIEKPKGKEIRDVDREERCIE